MDRSRWRIWVDTGGTFTDALGIDPQGRLRRAKVLSSSRLRAAVVESQPAEVVVGGDRPDHGRDDRAAPRAMHALTRTRQQCLVTRRVDLAPGEATIAGGDAIVRVDGTQPIDTVFANILTALGAL